MTVREYRFNTNSQFSQSINNKYLRESVSTVSSGRRHKTQVKMSEYLKLFFALENGKKNSELCRMPSETLLIVTA